MLRIFILCLVLALGEPVLSFVPINYSVPAHRQSRQAQIILLRESASTDTAPLPSGSDAIEKLREEYKNLQDRLRADLHENLDSASIVRDAEALLDASVQLTEAQRFQQEVTAETAHRDMQDTVKNLQQVSRLRQQAEQEVAYATNEAVWLESMATDHAELEALLLAHAAHDMHRTEELWQQTQEERLSALTKEVRAKDLFWYLVQKEETLKALQESHTAAELRHWAQHELPKHESILQVLREKLADHDPLQGKVAF